MYHYQRRYADELRTSDRALTIAPGDPDTLLDRATVAIDWRADIKPYQTMQGAVIAEKFSRTNHPDYMLCQRSAAATTRLLRNYPRDGVDDGVNVPYSYWEGVVARWQGDSGKSQTAFTAARSEVEKAVDKRPDFPEALSLLGMINAGLGRKEEALRQGRRACEPGSPGTTATNPKQERKSYYEKQKKYPDLHRRRTLHPRDLSELVAGCAPAPAPPKLHWPAYARRVPLL